ncbi:uncharacterized protein LOC111865382 [Cryptotermes secundus]|uniref:uncharacterized protein LOC111865382 n=1 Tax=Cryptotermes secundus TaxID=105785 RepID=UPI001454BAAB|nr:uncharacterized protein LOC111865382 [Cryptotermes secundus]XP_033607714.1 uncharacterized protein LOC111865382 [Cryptotermes secundus]
MSARQREEGIIFTEADEATSMAEEYISVSEALKLVTPFTGNKRDILTFISNVNTVFEVINPIHAERLYKFILTQISGEPRTVIARRNLENWGEMEEFLRSTYVEKRTLDFHANKLFRARQEKSENISEWIQKIQALGSKFREAALKDCTPTERVGILMLSDRLRNICFTQGLQSDRIQMIIRSKNQESFDEIAETALEEESTIFSKNERYKGTERFSVQCTNCKKLGHTSNKCYLRHKQEGKVEVSHFKTNPQGREFTCLNCGEKGHSLRFCKKPKKKLVQDKSRVERPGNKSRPSRSSPQTANATQ